VKVAVFPSDDGACGWYRLRWPALALAAQGADVVVDRPLSGERHKADDSLVRVIPDGEDVVVFQRIFRPELLEVIRSFQDQGVAVVVDVDDDVMALTPHHPVYHELHPSTANGRSWEVVVEACRMADLVTVSTPALAAKYAGHGRVKVVPNGVPAAYLQVERHAPRDVPVIGWTGAPRMHPGDLEVVGRAVRDVCARGPKFRAIGSAATLQVLGVGGEYHAGADLVSLDYAREYADLDVAIVPLAESAFNRSKSWLKGIEAAALGVPFVASPRAEYVLLHHLGAGLLAKRPRDWWRQLTMLTESADLRLSLAAKGRMVAADMTIEGWMAPQMFEAWTAARDNRVGRYVGV
jgi:hypothetical protein